MRLENQSQHQTHHRSSTMKTLVVVAALAAVVLAAPSIYESNYEGYGNPVIAYPQIFKRNRKSTQLDSMSELVPVPGTPIQPIPTDLETARTFLKKPIIVKKKQGYHVYRDSDEEQADSRETCVKQVKVKLCDADHQLPKSFELARIPGVEDNVMTTEDEMKHSIKLAKEAVENLQRDLKKADHKIGETKFKHDNSETDLELHHDIEVARQALEHIHQNFGNLESMSLHDSVTDMKEAETQLTLPHSVPVPEEERLAQWKEAETQQNLPFNMARSEEERLSQWKEALQNIDRNVEIVRNIEDSFKEQDKQMLLHPEHEVITNTEMRATIDKDNAENIEEKIEPKNKLEKSSDTDNLMTSLHVDDMSTSAATLSEIKRLDKINDATQFKNTMTDDLEKKITLDAEQLPKEAELSLLPSQHESQIDTVSANDEKARTIDLKEPATGDVLAKEVELKHPKDVSISGHAKDAVVDTDMFVKSAEPLKDDEVTTMLATDPKNTEDVEGKNVMDKKNAEDMIPPLMGKTTEWSDIEHKLAEPSKHIHENTMGKMTELSEIEHKSVEPSKHIHENTMGKMTELSDIELKSAEPSKHIHENIMDHREHQHEMMPHHHEMMSHHHINGPHHHDHIHHQMNLDHHNMRWSQDEMNMQMVPMRTAESVQVSVEHNHHLMEHALRNNIDAKHMSLQHPQQRLSENMMQGKSADMDNTFFMNMRDVNGPPMDSQRLRWKPTHETSRSAYVPAPGPIVGAAASSGAVGVFPNANVGPCGIPLLLSCNPSVVSGSLAKPHSYASPAYRTEDDFNFHNKRDVKKTENLTNMLKRTPNHVNTKTTILVSKQ